MIYLKILNDGESDIKLDDYFQEHVVTEIVYTDGYYSWHEVNLNSTVADILGVCDDLYQDGFKPKVVAKKLL